MNQMRCAVIAIVLCSLELTGCVSGYKQFYTPVPGASPEAIARTRASPPPVNPIVERARPSEPKMVVDAYLRRGYSVIGSSIFNSGRPQSEESAIQQALEVGADLVLIFNPAYSGSVTTAIPITTPTATTSYSSGTATVYGSRGPVTAYGSGTTTTYGSTTNYVPMTVHRSDYGAVFFVKRRVGLGIAFRDLSDAERQEMQTNKGIVIRIVVDGSPAFNSDLLVGDVVTAIDGIATTNSAATVALLRERNGKLITISLRRNGREIEKSIQIEP